MSEAERRWLFQRQAAKTNAKRLRPDAVARAVLPRTVVADDVPRPIAFVEKHHPGAWKAWQRDVGAPIDGLVFGVTSHRNSIAIAFDERCYTERIVDCLCREYIRGENRWVPRTERSYPKQRKAAQ